MKKIIFIIVTVIIIICLGIAGYFGIKYLTAPTDITITLNDEILDVDKIDDVLTYNEDLVISWDNEHYKVNCNGIEIIPGSYIYESGTYTFHFQFKDVEKTFQVLINKDLTFTLQDYEGNTIHNYSTNYKPFMIITEDELKVNNTNFDTTSGIYKIGDYKITSKNFDPCIVKINGINQMNEYNFYLTSNTLSTLYSAFNLINTDTPTYIWYGNSSPLNNEVLSQNENITLSEYLGDSSKLITDVIPSVKAKIKEILETNKNAYFHLYTDDSMYWIEFPLFAEIGLDDTRYDITYYSTGMKSYAFDELGYSYTSEDGYKTFLQAQEDQLKLLNNIKSNKYKATNEYLLGYLPNKYEYINDYILTSTFRNNITYVLEYPELLKFKDSKITNILKENENIYQSTLTEMYNSLNDMQKQLFLQYVNFDKLELDSMYFNQDNNKDYLVIVVNDSINGDYTQEELLELLNTVKENYGNDYNLLLKSSTTLNDDNTKMLNDLQIAILPSDLPLEIIMLIYDNLKIGGFPNSSFLSAPKGNTLFFFAKNKDELISPFNTLYHDLFNETTFISPRKEPE
ncbi:MAG: hypothetical protein Q4D02_07905 [Clostridia bacterium]|nr:hypothetical protein [Clostridia bacterium]